MEEVRTPKFAHLHVHTMYSLLDGSCKIKELVRQAKEMGMDSLAITDHGVMYGVIDFYKACLAEGIKPIIGCEVYVAPMGTSRFDREEKAGARYDHLLLLAENEKGYENLMKLVSYGFTEGYYYKPRIDFELLKQYHEGLIATSACVAGVVARALLQDSYDKAKETAFIYKELFGRDNFFLELQDHRDGLDIQRQLNQALMKMSRELDLDLIATNDVHYTYKEDKQAHDILLCVQTGKKVQDEDRMRYEGDYWLKSPEEMAELFPYAPEAITNTQKIADRCNVTINFHERKLPDYPLPPEWTSASAYLRMLCDKGLKERYADCDPSSPEYAGEGKARYSWEELKSRLDYEFSVIESMGFTDYFLVVWDFINFAKEHDIKVGPGRGSAAGSIIAYCLKITNIEPLQYSLVFERFLNPERVSMPDIDTDFDYRRRQEVIDYVAEKYGQDCVAQICTFGTMSARLVLRDVGRVLDMPYGEVDKIAKMVPGELNITLDLALEKNPELKAIYDEDEGVKQLIDMSRRLEGLPRHTSTHAAGVLITGSPTMNYVPLCTNDGNVVTQYTMTTLEELGLLKMDFLGLRTLTVIGDTVDMIRQTEGINVDIENLVMEDENIYNMIGQGITTGVFQLESAGMTQFMRELKPKNLEDVIAGIALYRPGPMDFIPQYLKGKKNQDAVTYKTPMLEPILNTTYGCIVYQEQVMQIVRDLAGYTMGRSDLVRRAMSKKKADVMEKEKKNFVFGNEEEGVSGCVSRGIDPKVAEAIYADMVDFAKYAFNKSHSVAYAVVAYETGYLRYYYPVEFMASMMNTYPGKVTEYIQQLKQDKVELLPPDINESYTGFSVVVDAGPDGEKIKKIRYGLASVKNVGTSLIDRMVEERKKNGPFLSMTDFARRMQSTDLGKRAMENLIKAGAFDSLKGNRAQYLQAYPMILDGAAQWKKVQITGQIDLFDMGDEMMEETAVPSSLTDPLPHVEEFPDEIRLSFEKEVLGLYLTGHPLAQIEDLWRKTITNVSTDFMYKEPSDEEEMLTEAPVLTDGQEVIIGGLIQEKTIKSTKNNKLMAFITVEDLYGTVEVLIFPNRYEESRDLLEEDRKVFVKGRVSVEEEDASKIICDTICAVEEPEKLRRSFGKKNYQGGYQGQGGYRRDENVSASAAVSAAPAANVKPLWLRLSSGDEWKKQMSKVIEILESYPGSREVRIFLQKENARMKAPERYNTSASEGCLQKLTELLGKGNVV